MTSNMASCNFLASKLMLFKMPLFITSGSSDHIDLRPPVQAEVRSMAEGRVRDLFKVLVSISRPSSDSWLPERYTYWFSTALPKQKFEEKIGENKILSFLVVWFHKLFAGLGIFLGILLKLS